MVETLEETKKFGIRFKAPKTKAGKREVALPDILREHRKAQLELRLQLGAGRPDDALLFARIDGGPLSIVNISSQ